MVANPKLKERMISSKAHDETSLPLRREIIGSAGQFAEMGRKRQLSTHLRSTLYTLQSKNLRYMFKHPKTKEDVRMTDSDIHAVVNSMIKNQI